MCAQCARLSLWLMLDLGLHGFPCGTGAASVDEPSEKHVLWSVLMKLVISVKQLSNV